MNQRYSQAIQLTLKTCDQPVGESTRTMFTVQLVAETLRTEMTKVSGRSDAGSPLTVATTFGVPANAFGKEMVKFV